MIVENFDFTAKGGERTAERGRVTKGVIVIRVIGRAETAEDTVTVASSEVVIRAVVRIIASIVVIVKAISAVKAVSVIIRCSFIREGVVVTLRVSVNMIGFIRGVKIMSKAVILIEIIQMVTWVQISNMIVSVGKITFIAIFMM